MFENRVLRKIPGLGGTTLQGSGENYIKRSFMICNSSPNVILVMKSRRRWAGRVARVGDKTGAYRVSVGTPEGKRPLGNTGVDGRVIINWIFKTLDGQPWIGLI